MGRSLKTDAGASIIEIMITLVIITLTTMLIMTFSRSTMNMSKDSRANDVAYLAAEEKLAELATKSFHSGPYADSVTIDNIPLHRTWTISTVNTIQQATVTVTYRIKGTNRPPITLSGAIN
ncbi:MAG: hypothetical protein JW863_13985 [Chitinispirillaceae bacterium]|nr:hypothetical protein [Chitinispirillaceae bacterium]